MPKVTEKSTIEFIRRQTELLEETEFKEHKQEIEIRKEEERLHNFLKREISDVDMMTSVNNFLDKALKITIERNIIDRKQRLQIIAEATVEGFYRKHLESESVIPYVVCGSLGGYLGKLMAGSGPVGIIAALAGSICGVLIPALLADKPDCLISIVCIEISFQLRKKFPDLKEDVTQSLGKELYNRCHYWAETHGGWAEAIESNGKWNALMEILKDQMPKPQSYCVIL